MSTAESETSEQTEGLTVEATALRTWASAVQHLVDEARVDISDAGLQTVMKDPANVAAIDATLTSDAIEGDHPETAVGLPMAQFIDAASALSSNTIELAAAGGERPTVELSTDAAHVTLDCTQETSIRGRPDLNDMDWDAAICVSAAELRAGVDYLSTVDFNGVWIDAEGTTLDLRPQDDDSDASVTIDCVPMELDPDATSALHSVDYLQAMLQSFEGDCEMCLELADEYPLRATFEPTDGVAVAFIQSPRIYS